MSTKRKGQSLVEFALVSLVMYLLLAAILTFGHALYVAQQVQMSADFLAREVSRQPLSSNSTLRDALDQTDVFDETLLDVEYSSNLQADIENWPIVNKMLSVVMLRQIVNGQERFRIPGMVERDVEGRTRYQIAKRLDAQLDNNDDWIDVVEEIEDGIYQLQIVDGEVQGGIVALRINYPIQSPLLTAFSPPAQFGNETGIGTIDADASEFDTLSPVILDPVEDLYGGDKGLGRQYAWGKQVRPFRRIVSGQAVYRREVYDQ